MDLRVWNMLELAVALVAVAGVLVTFPAEASGAGTAGTQLNWRWRWWRRIFGGQHQALQTGNGGSGGSGVVVLRVPNTAAAVFSGGVATRSYDVVGYTTYEVQATTTTGETVTFYPNAFLAEYLVVAGGGGGGGNVYGGGGGGWRFLASASAVAMAVVTGQAYPVIVGGGGGWRGCRLTSKRVAVTGSAFSICFYH
jgi:hypothetical protein